jgi:hypothetical protein
MVKVLREPAAAPARGTGRLFWNPLGKKGEKGQFFLGKIGILIRKERL